MGQEPLIRHNGSASNGPGMQWEPEVRPAQAGHLLLTEVLNQTRLSPGSRAQVDVVLNTICSQEVASDMNSIHIHIGGFRAPRGRDGLQRHSLPGPTPDVPVQPRVEQALRDFC